MIRVSHNALVRVGNQLACQRRSVAYHVPCCYGMVFMDSKGAGNA